MKVYVAKDDTWYDVGTIAIELTPIGNDSGLFLGTSDGQLDEEICGYDEFEIKEVEVK
jgi:hypothetical protein